jgi:anti-sigma regulatory factor (Ser/Thr protein kinase)
MPKPIQSGKGSRKQRGETVRSFILDNVLEHPSTIASVAAEHFSTSRQAVNKHLKKLVDQGLLMEAGNTKSRIYTRNETSIFEKTYQLDNKLDEYLVWEQDVSKFLAPLPENVMRIWQFGITEMINNAIDHSGGTKLDIVVTKDRLTTEVMVIDNGLGIFKKIQSALDLPDERHAVIELAKGKFTTDPAHHSGEGIFFTSRVMDSFSVMSGGVFFTHTFDDPEDWILQKEPASGTAVFMELRNNATQITGDVFSAYTSGEDYGFTKTVVPVRLAQYGSDLLISRSQAKRLLARVELFKKVLLDFKGVTEIGQGFADEVFRVFVRQHPETTLLPLNMSDQVQKMVSRAQLAASAEIALTSPTQPSPDH